jgi:hypothetical protein
MHATDAGKPRRAQQRTGVYPPSRPRTFHQRSVRGPRCNYPTTPQKLVRWPTRRSRLGRSRPGPSRCRRLEDALPPTCRHRPRRLPQRWRSARFRAAAPADLLSSCSALGATMTPTSTSAPLLVHTIRSSATPMDTSVPITADACLPCRSPAGEPSISPPASVSPDFATLADGLDLGCSHELRCLFAHVGTAPFTARTRGFVRHVV